MERRASPLPGGLDDPDRPQAVDGPLGEPHIAAEQSRQLPRAERTRRKRRQRPHDILGSPELNTIEHIDQAPLAWIPSPATRASSSAPAKVVLPKQQHLDGQMRMRQKRRKRDKPVKHVHHAGPPWRAPNGRNLTIVVDAHNAPLGRYWMDDPKPVPVEQRVKLRPQRRETTRLHLDQLAVRTNQIDHKTTDRQLEPVPRPRQHRLDRSMQRTLAQHPDVRHGHSVGVNPAAQTLGEKPPDRRPRRPRSCRESLPVRRFFGHVVPAFALADPRPHLPAPALRR